MKHTLNFHARLLASAAALIAGSAAFAQGAPSGVEIGRLAAPACTCVASSDAGSSSATPGPYAKYLIYQGMSKERALEAARSIDAGHDAAHDAVRRRAEASQSHQPRESL